MIFLQKKKKNAERVKKIFSLTYAQNLVKNYVKKMCYVICYFTIFVSLMNGPYILSPCRNPTFQSTLPADLRYPNLSA